MSGIPRNDIVYTTKAEAIDAMLTNSLNLSYGDIGVCKYIDSKDPTKVNIIQGVGTGVPASPVTIINTSGTSYHRGMNPPEDKGTWWVDTRTVEPDPGTAKTELEVLYSLIRNLSNRVDRIDHVFEGGIDAGTTAFSANPDIDKTPTIKPQTLEEMMDSEDIPTENDYTGPAKLIDSGDGDPKPWVDSLYPNVRRLCIKHDTSANLANYIPADWELIGCDDLLCVYIGYKGKYIKLTGLSSGGDPIGPIDPTDPDITKPMKYLDFITEDENVTMRMAVTSEGKIRTYNANEDDESIVQETGAGSGERNKGLLIAKVYAGNQNSDNTKAGICSHSFIELFNGSSDEINLRGLSLQVGITSTNWTVIPLKGIISPRHSYLVRLNPCADPNNEACLIHVDKFDLDAPQVTITNRGVKIYLCVGTTPYSENNPWTNVSGQSLPNEYIDLVGLRRRLTSGESYGTGSDQYPNINGYETEPYDGLDATKGVYRLGLLDSVMAAAQQRSPGDTNRNQLDFESFDYASNIVTDYPDVLYFPRTRSDGQLDMYWCRTKMSDIAPDMVTHSLGVNPTTRTFNWISKGFGKQYLYLTRPDGTVLQVESGTTGVSNIRVNAPDGSRYMTHKVIVRELEVGRYTYRVGSSGSLSDTYHLTVSESGVDPSGSFKFAQVSDQQGWKFSEYAVWGHAVKEVMKTGNLDETSLEFPNGDDGLHFLLNSGDMTQNGSRPHEWLDYFHQGYPYLPNIPQMNVVGNNDLCPSEDGSNAKALSTSFVYYYNFELDPVHPQLDTSGNLMRAVYAFDYGCAHFIVLNSNEWIQEQKTWFTNHINEVKSRDTQPSWIIVSVHDSMLCLTTTNDPNTIPGTGGRRDSKMNDATNPNYQERFRWSRMLEEAGVNLVLSGHKHTYTRTYPCKENVVPEDETYSINGWGVADPRLPVRYLEPLTQSPDELGGYVYTETPGYVTNIMCQATGFKLTSNKDVPAVGIPWLANYFPGEDGKNSKAQQYPTYMVFDITPEYLHAKTYQVRNVSNGGKVFEPYGKGESGVTNLDDVHSVMIDQFKLVKGVQ